MLAFLIDQVEQLHCALFKRVRERTGRLLYSWQRLSNLFLEFLIPD